MKNMETGRWSRLPIMPVWGRISGELVKQDADSSFDLWLVEETTRYVYRIMAIKQIFEAPYKYGFVLRAQDLYKPIACEECCRLDGYSGFVRFCQEEWYHLCRSETFQSLVARS